MNVRDVRKPLLEGVIEHPAAHARGALAELSTFRLDEFDDWAPAALQRYGVAVRYYPEIARIAAVPLGARRFLSPAGVTDARHPVFLDPDGGPVRLGLIGEGDAVEVEFDPRDDDTAYRVWAAPDPVGLEAPELPDDVVLAGPVREAVSRAAAAGGLGALIVQGLVERFARARFEDALAGRDPVGAWAARSAAGIPADKAHDAARLAATMAIQWDLAWRRLDDPLDLESEAWAAELCESLRLRDDLASCARVLRRLGLAGELDAILSRTDGEAASWLRSIPVRLALDDPHLAAVARAEDPFWAPRAWLAG